MNTDFISWVSSNPLLALLTLIGVTATASWVVVLILLRAQRLTKDKKLSLILGTTMQLLLVGAVVTGLAQVQVKRLEAKTKEYSANFRAMLEAELRLAREFYNEAESARTTLLMLSEFRGKQSGENPDLDNWQSQFNPSIGDFKYTKRPEKETTDKLLEVCHRIEHALSILPQLTDGAAYEGSEMLLWQKMDWIVDTVMQGHEDWKVFTQIHKKAQTQFSPSSLRQYFEMLISAYSSQREASRNALPKGLWELLGYLAVVIKLGESWWKYIRDTSKARYPKIGAIS